VDGVVITASGLTIDFDTLFNTCIAYYSAVKQSGVLRRQADAMTARGMTESA